MLISEIQSYRILLAACAIFVTIPHCALAAESTVNVTVRLDTVLNTMQGGIGASWHAIQDSIPVEGQRSHGGSGWGANPEPENEEAWSQLYAHAAWLGLDFCRVELESRIYEPQKGKFTWESREMRILYRILDWCETNGVDVFLQQMWCNVDWNSYPEFRGDPVKRVHSAPYSMEDFSSSLAALAGHLVREKGYRCIRWLSINNEPGWDWSWWQAPPNESLPITPGLKAVRAALDREGFKTLPLSGPDWTDTPALEPEKIDFDPYIGAYDIHCYNSHYDWMEGKLPLSLVETRLGQWAAWAHARNKPFFLTELGSMVYGWRGSNNGPNTFEAALKDAELVVRGLNARVDGFNKWSFHNRGDLDGQWQMVNTWDLERGQLLEKFTPKPNSYFVYGLVSRFTAKHSRVLASSVNGGTLDGTRRVFTAALQSPKGELTLIAVNDARSAWKASFSLEGLAGSVSLHKYQVTSEQRDNPELRIEPLGEFPLSPNRKTFSDSLPSFSLTVYSTSRLSHADRGIIAE